MGSSKTVLLVDDDADQLLLFSALLEREHCRVLSAHSGEAALRILAKHPVDLVVADISMPGMSGLALAERIRSDRVTSRVPIVLMTAGTEAIDFTSSSFRADMFCMKQNLTKTFIPGLKDILTEKVLN